MTAPHTLQHAIASECARLASGAETDASPTSGVAALASVVRRRGSLPMSATAKLLVTATGARLGTVGGGCLEAEIIERALDVMARREPTLSEHSLNAELAGDYGLTCGGTATLFIEPVFVDPVLAEVYAECAALLARGERALMLTAVDWSEGIAKALLTGNDAWSGTHDPAIRERLRATLDAEPHARDARREDADIVRASETPGAEMILERVVGAPRLVVVGAGHVGARVAEAAAFAGWRVTVVDDRADYADSGRLPFAERVVVCDFHEVGSAVPLDADSYVVVATRGHQHDAVIVEQLATRDLRYLGMLGSRRKVALTWRLLERIGIPSERLQRIHAPVGLDIGADTPAEIAISVVAEMIGVRRHPGDRV